MSPAKLLRNYHGKYIYISYLFVCLLKLCKDGAWVENKGALLTFHYRETPLESRPRMVDQAKKLIEAAGFKACSAHCAIEAKPPVEWNKGSASIYILRTAFGLDWSERIRIIYAGDDVTDEDAMKVRTFFISARATISFNPLKTTFISVL